MEANAARDQEEEAMGYHDTHGEFHLRNGFYYHREGDEIILRHDGGTVHTIRVPVSEWASAVAHTSLTGDNGETWRAVCELLGTTEESAA